MFRNLRSLLSYSWVPVRIAAQQERYQLYRVRFTPQDKRLERVFRALLVLGACQITANTILQIFEGEWEEPLFIPFGFTEKGPLRRYKDTDPEFQAFLRFNQDKKKGQAARAKVLDILVKNLEANNRSKFGGNVKARGSILYYHYPIGPPPEYTRKGLLISPTERDPSNQNVGVLNPLRLSTLKYEWVSRPVPRNTVHRLSTTLYPSWVFYSLYSSVQATFDWLKALKDSGKTVDSMGELVIVGTSAAKQGLYVTHETLRKTWKPPPPPRGHVVIDGIVHITGNDLVVGIDITASFNPETLGDLRFHRTQVRYAGKPKPWPKVPSPPIPPQFRSTSQKAVLVEDETPKDGVQAAIQAAAELQRRAIEQQRSFIDKQDEMKGDDQKGVIEEPKAREETDPGVGVKPIVQMLKEKHEEPIPDIPPSEGPGKQGEDKKQKADVDDAASSKHNCRGQREE